MRKSRNRSQRTRKPLPQFVHRATRPFHRRTRPGAAPGVIRTDPEAPASRIDVIAYGPEADKFYQATDFDLDDVEELIANYPVTWLNVDGLGSQEAIERVGELFGLHPLALEDVVHVHQRAKVEDYDDFLFLVSRMARLRASEAESPSVKTNGRINTEQVSLFLGRNFVVTFQERPGSDSFDPLRKRLQLKRGKVRGMGADALAYALLDAIIDGYFPVIEELGDRLERLDEDVLTNAGRDHLERLHRLRGDLLMLRRVLWPQREAVHVLIREPHPLLSEQTHYYLRDIDDHTSQSLDVVETYWELCSDLREYHFAQVGAKTNEVMKVLTVISTIFIPLTFIAGIYGMNFDTSLPGNMPELTWPWAYPATLLVMLVIGLLLLAWFWRKGWLDQDDQ